MLTRVKCSIGDCPSVFETNEAVSPKIRYVCKLHTESQQREFFQQNQFDKDLRMARSPIGTSHIPHQGSNTLSAAIIGKPYSWVVEDEEIIVAESLSE